MKASLQRFQHIAVTLQVLVVLACLNQAAQAQYGPGIPGTGDAIRQSTPPPPPDTGVNKREAAVPLSFEPEPDKSAPPAAGEKLFVKSFVLVGASEDEDEKLQLLLASYVSKELTMVEINDVARRVTNYYREQGYLMARALVPKQSMHDGALTIQLERGSYGNIDVKNGSRLRQRVVRRVFDQMKIDSPSVTQNSLERTMMLLAEMPGGTMPNVSVKSGKAAGTTDLSVKVDETRRFHGYLLGDNEGSQFTGRRRLYGGLDMNSPLGQGDVLSVAAMTTQDKGLKNGRVAYGFPLNYNGLRLTISYSQSTYSLGGVYASLGGTGTAKIIDGTLSYPVRRRHDENIDLLVNWAHKELHDDLKTVDTHNPRNANLGILTLQRSKYGTIFQHNIHTTMSASIAAGQLEVADATQRSLSGSDGTYGKLTVKLVAESPLLQNLSVKASLQMQKDISDKVLDSSEQLFISGDSGVRAYAESASGDNGYMLNTELRYTLPPAKILNVQHALFAFFDNGGIRAQKNATALTNFVLTDVGVGYSVNFHSAFLNVRVARSLGSIEQHNETDHTHVWVQLGYVF